MACGCYTTFSVGEQSSLRTLRRPDGTQPTPTATGTVGAATVAVASYWLQSRTVFEPCTVHCTTTKHMLRSTSVHSFVSMRSIPWSPRGSVQMIAVRRLVVYADDSTLRERTELVLRRGVCCSACVKDWYVKFCTVHCSLDAVKRTVVCCVKGSGRAVGRDAGRFCSPPDIAGTSQTGGHDCHGHSQEKHQH